ncbi:hypothetical protein RO3G_04201 [Lichtheimia corymbifera JMRC:FSU:9682]|uniref:Reverse transcriptase zinc-binding domain-containing protein n=1 Tax=Lichtheimia corymbifera JMRC:FSU:9682 TaxID=1263082 RepID=A0A068SH46_9FUNG|nr:hypothetical protein RO3G_04201 [Lichtheimia corymbifera JMRC:FSU:9682]
MLNRPRPPEVPRPICFLYPSSFWTRFWKLPLPHKAFNPWWRLLHDSVGTRQKLHAWRIRDVDSPLCQICQAGTEDLYHFFVDCPRKRPFWIDALQHFQLFHLLPNQSAIWLALTRLQSTNGSYIQESALCQIGCIVAILWRCHWRCIFDQEDWITTQAMNFLTSNVLYSSFIPSDLFSV